MSVCVGITGGCYTYLHNYNHYSVIAETSSGCLLAASANGQKSKCVCVCEGRERPFPSLPISNHNHSNFNMTTMFRVM